MQDEEKVTYFGETDARNKRIKFGIKRKDRSRHMYVIGKTGMGKSNMLENLAIQDIRDGNGLAFIDPHGKSADLLLEYIPKERINDVVYFAPFDMEYPVSFNVMEDVGAERRHLVSSGLMSAFKKIWVDAWSARMEYILNNIMLALLEYPGSTLLGVNRMLADKDFRKKVVDNITDPSVRSFWVDEYAKYTDKFAAEAAPAIQNKVGQFVTNPLIRNIIGQPKSTFDIRKIMDEKKILIINLSKGRVGESNANLLGSMLITKIYLAAMSRAEMNEKELKNAAHFYLYVDEFQSFANESFADILSEARKYKLNLIIAHQYIEQMSEEVRAAVFGNVGTMCVFRVGAYDAEVLEKEFAPMFTAEDIVNLQQYQMYIKLMIDSVGSSPFSARGLPPTIKPEISYAKEIVAASRASFARPRVDFENEITKWHQEGSGVGGAAGSGERRSEGSPRKSEAPKVGSGPFPHTPKAPNPPSTPPVARNSSPTAVIPPPGLQQQEITSPKRDNRGSESGTPQPRFAPRRDPQVPLASSPQNFSTRPNAPRVKAETAARENELRKAVSLSYLKAENEVKNDQKQAKPENVAALRDALLSVMKDTGTTMVSSSSVIPKQATTTSLVVDSAATPQPLVAPHSTPLEQKLEQKKDTPDFIQPSTRTSHNIPHTSKAPSEIPEEVLKKMFDVND